MAPPLLDARGRFFVTKEVPLDLLFFRRVFMQLNKVYGNGSDEIPLPLFQRAIVRLWRVLGLQRMFDANSYDLDKSGQVGWWEFVSCWREHNMTITLNVWERVYVCMDDPSSCFLGKLIAILIMTLILMSSSAFMVASVVSLKVQQEDCPWCEPKQNPVFDSLEAVAVTVFTLEYTLRVTAIVETRQELLNQERIIEMITDEMRINAPSRIKRIFNFVMQPSNLVDLAAILPFYMELSMGGGGSNSAVLRIIRLTRLFRLLKLGRYFEVLQLMARVLRMSTVALYVLIFYLLLGVFFSSSLMYFAEGGEWDGKAGVYVRTLGDGSTEPTPFQSIPGSFWWCIVTYTTVGYGDVYPVTLAGKLVATITMLVGILVVAMPVSVVSSNFHQVWGDAYEEQKMEVEAREQEQQLVSEALLSLSPPCQRLTVEVWDHNGMGRADDFLGEAHFSLPTDSLESVETQETVELTDNKTKGNQKRSKQVTGDLTVKIKWEPDTEREHHGSEREHHDEKSPQLPSPAANSVGSKEGGVSFEKTPSNGEKHADHAIHGRLTVTVVSAKDLANTETGIFAGKSDPFAVVNAYPHPPDKTGLLFSETFRTAVINDNLSPWWDHEDYFVYSWPKDQVTKGRHPGRISFRNRQSILNSMDDAPAGPLWKNRLSKSANRPKLLAMGGDAMGEEDNALDEEQLLTIQEEQRRSAKVLEGLKHNLHVAEKTSAEAMGELEAQAKQLSELQSCLLELYSEARRHDSTDNISVSGVSLSLQSSPAEDPIRYYQWEKRSSKQSKKNVPPPS